MKEQLSDISTSELINILVSNTPVGYVVLDKKYRIHFINEYFMKMRGYTKENTLGRHCYDLSNNGKKCNVCALESAITTRMKQKVMRKDILPNGDPKYIEDYAIPLYKDDQMNFDYLLEIMINRTSEMVYREKIDNDFLNLITSLITMLDAKDEYTAKHSINVSKYSVMLANELGISADHVFNVEIAATLHDIGKVNIPYSIINKAGKLDDDEFAMIKKHPGNSYVILQGLTGFPKVKEYVRYHHERFDGRGYPDGLAGNEIPLGARIISIADTYEAMTSSRSYRKALSHETAIEEIKRNAGTQFDVRLVDVFVNMNFDVDNVNKPKARKNISLVERQLVESDAVINQTKNAYMEKMETQSEFSKTYPDEKFIEDIFSNTPVAYVLMKPDYEIVYASPFFLSTFKMNLKEIKGSKCFEASGAGAKCPNCPMEKAKEKGELVQEELIQIIDGKTKYFDCFAMPYFNENEELTYILEILLDRTEEKEMQLEHERDLYNIIQTLSDLLAVNDQTTFIKSKFIRMLCDLITNKLSLTKEEENEIDIAATLCDIGMISIKDVTLENEDIIKTHPTVAYNILGELSVFKNIKKIIKHHHETFNAKGYPDALAGAEIPLGSRIIGIANAYFDYSQISHEFAMKKISDNEDLMFDPDLVNILVDNCDEWFDL